MPSSATEPELARVGTSVGADVLGSLLDRLACPKYPAALRPAEGVLACRGCATTDPVVDGIADLRLDRARTKPEHEAWTAHWAPDHQQAWSQRFFSLYRKAIFAPTVAHYVNGYLARSGALVEAGSATSETSIGIDKSGGLRRLVAVDVVLPVLRHCAPIMDARVSANVFRMPFAAESIDGLWNVGVMEPFEHDQIDQMLLEFSRVLKPGGRLFLLWPGLNSPPQRVLRGIESVANAVRRTGEPLRLHPAEISRLARRGASGSSQKWIQCRSTRLRLPEPAGFFGRWSARRPNTGATTRVEETHRGREHCDSGTQRGGNAAVGAARSEGDGRAAAATRHPDHLCR